LIIGCGCRGLSLARALQARGHAVRGTTRRPLWAAEIEAAGAEARIGDPDRVATIAPAFEHVTIACLLLGSALGAPEQIAELHGPRLEMLFSRMLDTTVRAVVYETAGTVDPAVLSAGAERVRTACQASLIPYQLLDADPSEREAWLTAAVETVQRGLESPG
jgi:Trk K+ transport system NAD-binding subunit